MQTSWLLAEVRQGESVMVTTMDCSPRTLSRLAPLGVVRGAGIEVLRNTRKGAMLIEVRNTVVALSRAVSQGISVCEATHE